MRANDDGEEAEASGAWRARRGSSLLALDGRDDVLGRLVREWGRICHGGWSFKTANTWVRP